MTLFGTTRHTGYQFSTEPENVWRYKAACIGTDPTVFELIQVSAGAKAPEINRVLNLNSSNIEKALKVCAACPVQAECLRDADESDRAHTVRGGRKPMLFTGRGRGRPKKGDEETCPKGHKGPWRNTETGRKCLSCSIAPSGRTYSNLRASLPEDQVSERSKARHRENHPDHEPRWARDSKGYPECATCRVMRVKINRTPFMTVREIHAQADHDHKFEPSSNGKGRLRCRICANRRKRLARMAKAV